MTKQAVEVKFKNAFSPKSVTFGSLPLEEFHMKVQALYTLKCNHLEGEGELHYGATLHVRANKLAFKKHAKSIGFRQLRGSQTCHVVYNADGEIMGYFFVRGNQYFMGLFSKEPPVWENLSLVAQVLDGDEGGFVGGLYFVQESPEVEEVEEVQETAICLSAGFWGVSASKWESQGMEYDNAPVEIVFEGQTLHAKLQKFNNPTWGKWANIVFDGGIEESLLDRLDEFLDVNDDCRYLRTQIRGGRVVGLSLDIDQECAEHDAWVAQMCKAQKAQEYELHTEKAECSYCACVQDGRVVLDVGGQDSAHFVSYQPLEGQDVVHFKFRQGRICWASPKLDYSHARVLVCFKGIRAYARLKPTPNAQFYTLEFRGACAGFEQGLVEALGSGALFVRSKVHLFVRGWEVCGGRARAFVLDVDSWGNSPPVGGGG
ncbi:hypothetical protein [Helicobacter bizzozeronii]|uniref:hypothetical protein n=1 Tax=Helicobacter bizzozeronii TaxID=56877 RepID=UPI000CEEDB12|nr:hypothetical protein [Helicobacter bizzozeronii]